MGCSGRGLDSTSDVRPWYFITTSNSAKNAQAGASLPEWQEGVKLTMDTLILGAAGNVDAIGEQQLKRTQSESSSCNRGAVLFVRKLVFSSVKMGNSLMLVLEMYHCKPYSLTKAWLCQTFFK